MTPVYRFSQAGGMKVSRTNYPNMGVGVTSVAIPFAPTIGAATATDTASVTFTPSATGATATSYTATSSPGGFTGTAASSPITVSGLTAGTAYTFTVTATNANGTSNASSASNSVTPTSVSSYDSIQTITLSGNQSSIAFTSIPSTYKHLQIRGIASGMDNTNVRLQFNSDNGSNYSWSNIKAGAGYGSSMYQDVTTNQTSIMAWDQQLGGNTYFNIFTIDILNYAQTTTYKSVRSFAGSNNISTNGFVFLTGGLYTGSTAAISRIDMYPTSNPFYAGSSFALYGIKG